ncbi:MAG: phosphotransferase [Proteobacteria bacterium]|nr:phosphotransferase [Pseudomonadota bacterium]
MTAAASAVDEQQAVIAFLSDPAAYGLRRGRVSRIETHCSAVFLAGNRAYKLKRAIRYAALDYTTRELRRAACEAELRLNRRTAPELYLAVLPITQERAGALALDGAGCAVDHVVVMRRFPQSALFSRMAEAGRLTPDLMRTLGATVARFHLAAEVTPDLGGSAALRCVIASNDHELAAVASELDGAAVAGLRERSLALLQALTPLLEQRRAAGKVRRCHGDLRLPNICLYQGRPTLFDCIEFSDAVSCTDVLHDLAFLLMDLRLGGRGDLANVLFNAYLDVAPETEGLRALPLFLALRAATRAYALAGSARRQTTPHQARRQRALARQHIAAALAWLAPPAPRLVAVGGVDHRRAALAAGIAGLVPPPPGARVLHFRPDEPEAADTVRQVAEAGCSVVVESACPAGAWHGMQALAERLALPWSGIWFGAPPPDLGRDAWQVVGSAEGLCGALAQVAASFKATAYPVLAAGGA